MAGDEIQDLKSQIEKLKKINAELKASAVDMRDFVFNQLPRQRSYHHTSALSEFSTLRHSVDGFVTTHLLHAIDHRIITQENRFELAPAIELLALVPASGKEAFNQPDTDMYTVCAAVMNFLCREVFQKPLYGTTNSQVVSFLEAIENNLRALEPSRSKHGIYKLRR